MLLSCYIPLWSKRTAWPWQSGYCRLSPCAGCTPAASDTHSQWPRWTADPCGWRKNLIFHICRLLKWSEPLCLCVREQQRGTVWKQQRWDINNCQNLDKTEINWALLSHGAAASRFYSEKSSDRKWELGPAAAGGSTTAQRGILYLPTDRTLHHQTHTRVHKQTHELTYLMGGAPLLSMKP